MLKTKQFYWSVHIIVSLHSFFFLDYSFSALFFIDYILHLYHFTHLSFVGHIGLLFYVEQKVGNNLEVETVESNTAGKT